MICFDRKVFSYQINAFGNVVPSLNACAEQSFVFILVSDLIKSFLFNRLYEVYKKKISAGLTTWLRWNIKSYNGYLRLNPDFNLSDISFFNQIFGNLDSIQCGSFFDLITYNPEG